MQYAHKLCGTDANSAQEGLLDQVWVYFLHVQIRKSFMYKHYCFHERLILQKVTNSNFFVFHGSILEWNKYYRLVKQGIFLKSIKSPIFFLPWSLPLCKVRFSLRAHLFASKTQLLCYGASDGTESMKQHFVQLSVQECPAIAWSSHLNKRRLHFLLIKIKYSCSWKIKTWNLFNVYLGSGRQTGPSFW